MDGYLNLYIQMTSEGKENGFTLHQSTLNSTQKKCRNANYCTGPIDLISCPVRALALYTLCKVFVVHQEQNEG